METPQILDSIFRKVKTVIELEIERGNETATVQYESMNDTVSRIYCEWWDLFRDRLIFYYCAELLLSIKEH